jgi:hypothetical protein
MYRHAHSWLDGPSEPGPTSEDFYELTDKHAGDKKHLELKEVTAAKLAVEAIEKGKRRDVFWAGGRGVYATLSPRDKASLPIRVFNELDRELFRGVLRGQVCLATSTAISPAIHGATRRAGPPYGRVTILFNPEIFIMERPEVVLATLIHHMAHAYFLVCCGYGGGDGQHNLKHGLPISTLLWTIKACFLRNHRSFPNLFRCTDNLSHYPIASSFIQYGMEGQSYCPWQCNDFKGFEDCYNYLHKTLRALKLDEKKKDDEKKRDDEKKKDDEEGSFEVEKHYPRSQYVHLYQASEGILEPVLRSQFTYSNPSRMFIEFHYQGKAIPLTFVNLRYGQKFCARLAEKQLAVVKVPKDVATKTFKSILAFATHGEYDPPWMYHSYTSKGPPKIDTGSGNVSETGPFVPIEDFRVYAVAQTIGFEELTQYALRRLYSQSLLKGDAMDFVEEVYTGKEPGKDKPVACGKGWKLDKDLRDFMVAFLMAEHPDRKRIEVEVDEYGRTMPVGPTGMGIWRDQKQTNLGLLQGPKWRERLRKLRAGGGAFLEDLDKIEDLKQGTRVDPPAFVRSGTLPWSTPLVLEGSTSRLGLGYEHGPLQPVLGYPAYSVADDVMVDDHRRTYVNRPGGTQLERARQAAVRRHYGLGDLTDGFENMEPFGRW